MIPIYALLLVNTMLVALIWVETRTINEHFAALRGLDEDSEAR
jgi:hypothetical protein